MTEPDSAAETAGPMAPETAEAPVTTEAHGRRWYHSPLIAVAAATLAFAAACLGFLINTPTLLGPDEVYHLDRVVAAEHGQIVLGPASVNTSRGARGIEHHYVRSYMKRGGKSQAEYKPIPRVERPSLNALGGNSRSKSRDVANYETQHPPLYYALMGGLVRLWPGADNMAGDKFVLLIRSFNVLIMLTLPLLFWLSARWLLGDNAVSRAAAFLPLIVPGLARFAATINNDNLAIPLGLAAIAFAIRIFKGDRTVRTAVIVSLICLGASLTKGTALVPVMIVPLAYFVQWIRERRGPSVPVAATLGTGAIAAGAWWIHNLVRYGKIEPNAWGSQTVSAQGRPRGSIPIDWGHFFKTLYSAVPSRFWAALGLHEPPKLPHAMIVGMSAAIVILPIITFLALRGQRWLFFLLFALPAGQQLVVIGAALQHYLHYLAIPGIQGRYVYPSVFGLLLPFAIGAALVLRRYSSWAPLLILALGLLNSGWALYTSAEYTWLHRGERLVPSNWSRAFDTLAGFFPIVRPGLLALMALGALLIALAVAGCVLTCWVTRDERYGWREMRDYVPPAAQPAPELAPAAV